ncbi:MAG: S41 family peptidase [Bacteroidota bacterium]
MRHLNILFVIIGLFLFQSCRVNKNNFTSSKLYPKESLQSDYTVMKNILESKHPSLYWYTSKDSIDYYFDYYYQRIQDSMTEQDYAWHVLAPMINKIHCGHTSVSMSKANKKWSKNRKFPSFPLDFKIWNDTMAVTASLLKNDNIFKRGTIVKSINGVDVKNLISKMLDYLPEDGYAHNVNYIRLSAGFPVLHKYIFGLSKEYTITYIDSVGHLSTVKIPLYIPAQDSSLISKKDQKNVGPKIKFKKIESLRSFKIDSTGLFAVMKLNTFSNARLRSFFRRSFKTMEEKNIPNLIIDIRLNGGGNVNSSTLLTRYISKAPFKVADSVFTHTQTLSPYSKYFKWKFLNNIELFLITKKKADHNYHLTPYENIFYQPKTKNHFEGNTYVLINGPSFSASCLFASTIKAQKGVKLIGEETGGGWYGNNGIMIPDVTLPHTKLKIRMPLFRVVQYNHDNLIKGKGISPDIYIPTNYDALLKGYDKKMQVVKEMIYDAQKFK